MTHSPPLGFLILRDPVAGQSFVRLQPGQTVTFGRAPTNSVVLQDDRASRCHAEIVANESGWLLRDLGSRNGTTLNAEPITAEQPLAPGDVIRIGAAELLVCAGEPHDSSAAGAGDGTATHEVPADLDRWNKLVVHRRTKTSLLEELQQSAGSVPRVGRAAAELCRLAFALGRATDAATAAKLTLESALKGCGAARGIVLLPGADPDAAKLSCAASLPSKWPADQIPWDAVTTVMAANEALLARAAEPAAAGAARGPTLSAPVRAAGRQIGVLHLEMAPGGPEATPDDLEFVMAVGDALGMASENLAAREVLSSRLASTADENQRLRQRLGEETKMVGTSPALQAIISQIFRVASTKATVLIRGESGAGKELVARAIHEASDRKNAPFICLNCAALSETLLESELFGHEKGAFTGATERKAGKFEAANKGTLFLDEIGEMSPAIQAKFLRVLEGHPFERVGGSQRVQVDVRVVAATNRHLEKAVAAGEFRRDLYFRLKVVEITVPPLRERPDDIETLARHFLRRFAAETGRAVRDFRPEALVAMREYHWPGNIRELRNCIERAVVLSADDTVDIHELALSSLSSFGDTGAGGRPAPFKPETLDALEHRHVLATLAAVAGNKSKAAAILGIERSTLDRKLGRWAKE